MGNGTTREGIPFEGTGRKNPPDEETRKSEGKTGGIKERDHTETTHGEKGSPRLMEFGCEKGLREDVVDDKDGNETD